ncbi:MAG: cysteine desulfurase, partial [Gammaproteobacteria bacterium]|nr:cysteine desulfurase [Gammaproteobacteria bacterium]
IETARSRVAELVNARPEHVIFTSGGTEANNLAFKGFLAMDSATTMMCSAIEHASVLHPFKQVKQAGCSTHLLPVTADGITDVERSKQLIQQYSPDLVSLQLANNETGVIQPVEQIARFSHANQVSIVHTDATQAVGKIAVDFQQLDVDMVTLSAHKFQGPQAVGALIVKSASLISPLLTGGLQESGRRAGTENVAMLVGLGKAAQLARIKLQERNSTLLELRRYFEQKLAAIAGIEVFGANSERLPNTCYFAIPYYHGETLLMQLDQAGFELASGSACHSEVTLPSHVLSAMGVDEDLALNAVRVSFGMENTHQQIDQLIDNLNNLINQLPAVMRQVAN